MKRILVILYDCAERGMPIEQWMTQLRDNTPSTYSIYAIKSKLFRLGIFASKWTA